MTEQKRNFTDADRAAHARLRALWGMKAKPLGLTQAKAADMFGATQGLISHYLNGRLALGRVATLQFARILKVPPEDIRADFEYSRLLPDDVPDDVIRMTYKLAAMPDAVRADLDRTIDLLFRAQNYEAFLKKMEAETPKAESETARR